MRERACMKLRPRARRARSTTPASGTAVMRRMTKTMALMGLGMPEPLPTPPVVSEGSRHALGRKLVQSGVSLAPDAINGHPLFPELHPPIAELR